MDTLACRGEGEFSSSEDGGLMNLCLYIIKGFIIHLQKACVARVTLENGHGGDEGLITCEYKCSSTVNKSEITFFFYL